MISETSDAREDVAFCDQSQVWLANLAARNRKPVAPATLNVFANYIRRLNPMVKQVLVFLLYIRSGRLFGSESNVTQD
jgi:hypothetical protein